MAINKYSQPVQLRPVDVFDEEAIGKALTIKQLKYDQGVQTVQLMMDQVSNLDIVNETQQKYLQDKMESVLNQVNQFSGVDFSNNIELSNLNKVISSVTDDPVVRNALQSSNRYRQYQKNKEELWTNPKSEEYRNVALRMADEKDEQAFLNSENLNASWSRTMPRLDSGFDKEVYIATNEVKTSTGTRFLQGGKYRQDYEFRTAEMMRNGNEDRILNDPAHREMLSAELSVLYDTEDKKRKLFERGLNVQKEEVKHYIKGLEAQRAIENTSQLEAYYKEAQQKLNRLENTQYSEDELLGIYSSQRFLQAMAPTINIDKQVEVNQGYYKEMDLDLESRKFLQKIKQDELDYQLKADKLMFDLNPNISSSLAQKYNIPASLMNDKIIQDSTVVIPEKSEIAKNYSMKINTLAESANNTLRQGLLSLISKGNTNFFNELKSQGVLNDIQNNSTLGENALRTLDVLNERVLDKSNREELLSPLEKDFVSFYDNYQQSMALVNLMKEEKENIISPVVNKYGYSYEDYLQYKIDNKDEKGFLSNLFSSKEGIEEFIEDIDEEIETSFSTSNANTFNMNNNMIRLDGLADADKPLIYNEIRNSGLIKDGETYSVNNPLRDGDQVLQNVDFSKINLIKYNPNTGEATVSVESGSGKTKNISDFIVKMSDATTANLSNKIIGKPYSPSYQNTDEELDKYLKREKKLIIDGKPLEFSLHSITQLPFSNQVSYSYDDFSDAVNVHLSNFGTFNFKGSSPKTITDAKKKLSQMFNNTYIDLKKRNPNASDEEVLKFILKYLKDNGYAYR